MGVSSTSASACKALALALALFVVAQQSRFATANPVLAQRNDELPQMSEYDMAEFGFGDWLEKIKNQIGDALEKAKDKAKEILDDIKDVSGDAWEKIKQAVEEIKVAKDKFVETVLPKILEALKSASKTSAEKLEPIVEGIVDILKELGQKALEQALAYILQHKDDIDHKIFEIIMAHLNKAIDKVAGSSSYAFDEMDEDQIKLVLKKMLNRCSTMDTEAAVVVVTTLRPLGFQRVVRILQDMKIENPVDSDLMEALIKRVQAVAGVVEAASAVGFCSGRNIFEDILEKIIAKADQDPEKFAKIIIKIYGPFGKDFMQHLIDNLKKMYEEYPKDALKTIIKLLEESLKAPKSEAVVDWMLLKPARQGRGMLETVKEMAEAWLKQIIESASSLKEVEDKVINELLPRLIESVREVANETSEAARKVSEMVVYLLRRLGSRAIERAIEFIDDHADAVGERLHDFLLSLLQDALAEISYVRQVGYAQAIASISRGKA